MARGNSCRFRSLGSGRKRRRGGGPIGSHLSHWRPARGEPGRVTGFAPARSGNSLSDLDDAGPTPDADLIPSDPEYVAVGQMAEATGTSLTVMPPCPSRSTIHKPAEVRSKLP